MLFIYKEPSSDRNSLITFLLIVGFILPIYANSITASWHLDDTSNIVNNSPLHISDLAPQTLWKTFFASPQAEQKLYRPLPCLSFALNWYIGGSNTSGYHIVNIGLHIATALALYFLFIRLLLLIDLREQDKKDYHISSVALLGAVLWAINPIHTQAVTYIVQRMAILTALFYVLSLLYFVKARTVQNNRLRWTYSGLSALWFLFAMSSKENAIMLPFSLILVEWIFFQKGRTDFLRKPVALIISGSAFAAALIITVLFIGDFSFEFVSHRYNSRPFSMIERLLTQPRVLIGYLTQIFYPLPERLSIAHDVTVSTSFFRPWTTMPAIVIIFSIIASAMVLVRRYPLIAFAVLFFFLNHLIESSFLSLEMVFEHRNYLPSLFLFLPIASGLHQLLTKFKQNSQFLYTAMASVFIIMLVSVGLSTHTRNKAWATEISLWTDAARKAPHSIRPLVTLGIELGWKTHPSPSDYRHALVLFRKAFELPPTARKTEKVEVLGNIASILSRQGKHDDAISVYLKALELNSSFLKNRYDLTKALIVTGRFAEAEHHARNLVKERPNNSRYLNILGFILLWQDKHDDAINYFQRALSRGGHSSSLYLNIGVTLTRLEKFENARWFLQRAVQKSPDDFYPLLALIENRSRVEDQDGADMYARQVVSSFPVGSIIDRIHNMEKDHRSAPLSAKRIDPIIRKAFYLNPAILYLDLNSQIS